MNNNPPNPNPSMIEAGIRAWEEPGNRTIEQQIAAIYLAMRAADQPPPNTGLTDVERDKLVDYLRRQGRQGNKQQPIVPVAASELLKAADFIATDNERCDHDQQDGGAAAIAAISQQPVHADEDELGDGSDFGVTGEWWGNADEVERALIRVGQDLEAAKRDGLTTNTLFNIADVRTLRAALLVSNRIVVELGDAEDRALAWLTDYAQRRHCEAPEDVAFDAQQMIDAFMEGAAVLARSWVVRARPSEIARDRADWLLDAIATATQDRRYLRGDPEYDEVAGEVILLNAEKAILVAMSRTALEKEQAT